MYFAQKVNIWFIIKKLTISASSYMFLIWFPSSGLARLELATRGFGDHRSTSELQPYIIIVQSISLILCLKHDISSKEHVFDLALLLRGSLHWEVVYPSNSNLLNWVEVSKSDSLPSRCIFLVKHGNLAVVSQ